MERPIKEASHRPILCPKGPNKLVPEKSSYRKIKIYLKVLMYRKPIYKKFRHKKKSRYEK